MKAHLTGLPAVVWMVTCLSAAAFAQADSRPRAQGTSDIQVAGTTLIKDREVSRPAEHREFCVYAGDKELATFRTDEAGRFAFRIPASRLEGMPRGSLMLTVRPVGYAQVHRDLLLGRVEFEVARTGRLLREQLGGSKKHRRQPPPVPSRASRVSPWLIQRCASLCGFRTIAI